LVASTHDLSTADFMAGKATFNRNGATGSVVNEGNLSSHLGGYIALLAPNVQNSGIIVAQLGTVALAAGEAMTLHFAGNQLTSITVSPSKINALVENKQAVLAPGGLIILSAMAANQLQGGVVNNSGRLEANGLAMRGGKIVLEASTRIDNSGQIRANAGDGMVTANGTVLAGGGAGTITLTAPSIRNSGEISANNTLTPTSAGTILLTADQIVQTATGRLDVHALQAGGNISLQATQDITLAGTVDASAAPVNSTSPATGGNITLQAGRQITLDSTGLDASGNTRGGQVWIQRAPATPTSPPSLPIPKPDVALLGTSQIRVNSRRGSGGQVTLLGEQISLLDNTLIEVMGATAGGSIHIGGGWQGSGTLAPTVTTRMVQNVTLNASATAVGNGGEIVLWSDIYHAQSVTQVAGTLLAQGGANGGNGGRIETSGHQLDLSGIRVATTAPHGNNGLWLIDPWNVIISNALPSGTAYANPYFPSVDSVISASSINAALQAGNNVTITTGTIGASLGDISVNSPMTSTSTATLSLQAAHAIYINQTINLANGTLVLSGGNGAVVSGIGNILASNVWLNNTGASYQLNTSGTWQASSTLSIDCALGCFSVGGAPAFTTGTYLLYREQPAPIFSTAPFRIPPQTTQTQSLRVQLPNLNYLIDPVVPKAAEQVPLAASPTKLKRTVHPPKKIVKPPTDSLSADVLRGAFSSFDSDPNAVLDALAARHIQLALAKGIDRIQAEQMAKNYNAILLRQLALGLPMETAMARAEIAFQTELNLPRAASLEAETVKNLTAGGVDTSSRISTLMQAETPAGATAFEQALSAELAKGISFDDAILAARSAVTQVDGLAKTDDLNPKSQFSNENKQVSEHSAEFQQTFRLLVAKGYTPEQAMQRATQLETQTTGNRPAPSITNDIASGQSSTLLTENQAGNMNQALTAALARGVPMENAVGRLHTQQTAERQAAENDAHNPMAIFSSGRIASDTDHPVINQALANAIAHGHAPGESIRFAPTAAAPSAPVTPVHALASGAEVDGLLLHEGASSTFKRVLGNALAQGLSPNQALTIAKRAEYANAFHFRLPPALKQQRLKSRENWRVTLSDGNPLPTWLRFDAQLGEFTSTDVPAGAFPLPVILHLGKQHIKLDIAEGIIPTPRQMRRNLFERK
jgi:hypothetical protein